MSLGIDNSSTGFEKVVVALNPYREAGAFNEINKCEDLEGFEGFVAYKSDSAYFKGDQLGTECFGYVEKNIRNREWSYNFIKSIEFECSR